MINFRVTEVFHIKCCGINRLIQHPSKATADLDVRVLKSEGGSPALSIQFHNGFDLVTTTHVLEIIKEL